MQNLITTMGSFGGRVPFSSSLDRILGPANLLGRVLALEQAAQLVLGRRLLVLGGRAVVNQHRAVLRPLRHGVCGGGHESNWGLGARLPRQVLSRIISLRNIVFKNRPRV